MTTESAPTPAARGQFAEVTAGAAIAVHVALGALVASVPGNVTKPRELQHALEIDYKLAWRVFLVLRAHDAMSIAGLIPKQPSVRRLLDAARNKALPGDVVNDFEQAVRLFEEIVRAQAGSRLAFDSIVTGMAPSDGKEQIDVVERRTAYRANSHIWGSQVNTYVYTVMCQVDAVADRLVCCKLGTRLGFKRLRPDAQATAHLFRPSHAVERDGDQLTALDPDAERLHGAALLLPFCSQPLPSFKKCEMRDGWVYHDLADDAIGQANAVDLAVGAVERRPLASVKDGAVLHVTEGIEFRTPAERLIFDIVIHRPTLGRVNPRLVTAAGLVGENSLASLLERVQFPLRTDVRPVPGGIRAAAIPQMPRYADMLQFACKRLDWEVDAFDVYRAIVQYPILHSTVIMRFDSPAA